MVFRFSHRRNSITLDTTASLVLTLILTSSTQVQATPLLALQEADNCGGCHKPGRSQKPFLLRRCTLDCQGCHIDPSGAGPRNQWGYYYTQTGEGVSTFNFFEPQDPLQDTSRIDFHSDIRFIRNVRPDKTLDFPMSAEGSIRVRPFVKYLHLTYQALLLGKSDDEVFRVVREGDRRFREKYSVMVDEIPLNTYVRAYRGIPMYGLRRPNHTLWIRQRIGLDQYATTEAVELGIAPNVPYFKASVMSGDPYITEDRRQKGFSYHGGLRGVTLGWHINASGWQTKSDYAEVNMNAVGIGANIFGLILYAERNNRQVDYTQDIAPSDENPEGLPSRVHPSSQISEYTAAFNFYRGVMLGSVYETLKDDDNTSFRTSIFLDLHPIPNLQLEFWRRYETGSRNLADTIATAHLYGDF